MKVSERVPRSAPLTRAGGFVEARPSAIDCSASRCLPDRGPQFGPTRDLSSVSSCVTQGSPRRRDEGHLVDCDVIFRSKMQRPYSELPPANNLATATNKTAPTVAAAKLPQKANEDPPKNSVRLKINNPAVFRIRIVLKKRQHRHHQSSSRAYC